MKRTSKDWRKGTKRNMIAELAERGLTKRQTFSELRQMVEAQLKPMVFSANVGGHREPKPLSEQLVELKNEIGRVYAILGRAESSDFESDEISADESSADENSADGCDKCGKVTELFHDDESGLSLCEDCLPKSEEKPEAKGKKRIAAELARFLVRVREIRKFCEQRAELSESLDAISMRPAQAAAKLIPAGIPADALLFAMTMHWPKDARADANIADFDFIALSLEIMRERNLIGKTDRKGNPFHALFGYALVLAENRQPIMLIGPAGTGKSHLAKQLADYLSDTTGTEFPYGETPMSPGATRGDLLGRHTIGGFIPSEFCVLYSGGGVFNFEEIDASDPSMLIVLNNALAQDELFNSANGESYKRSPNFIAVSTANTFGLGANRDFTGRERLDAATIDRWRMGRIFLPLDESIEEKLLSGATS